MCHSSEGVVPGLGQVGLAQSGGDRLRAGHIMKSALQLHDTGTHCNVNVFAVIWVEPFTKPIHVQKTPPSRPPRALDNPKPTGSGSIRDSHPYAIFLRVDHPSSPSCGFSQRLDLTPYRPQYLLDPRDGPIQIQVCENEAVHFGPRDSTAVDLLIINDILESVCVVEMLPLR
ncbi:hypothetical protein BCR34DRAFT_561294 [Clohesyomyces aquaticus]|uniref:Uncharacterized protein n=1 Tax=Clohesyomyces aquaticus TaxID=1231657 RepID=A0A1Y1ZV60_9PLEO|nr:hypothetical protein BCR34DRAFT_561294 [Clohesyomyces aquaticus]